jgi:glycosyltransferase involved in cell wall biosynthesis
MRVAVVTPYFRERDYVLRQCLDSVAAQPGSVSHILVADGCSKDWASRAVSHHIVLPGKGHGDNGNLARAIGTAIAMAEGFDAIALLDADNWYKPDHIASLLTLHQQTGAAICTTARSLHRIDGSLLAACDRESDGIGFADTSCMFYLRQAFAVLPLWGQIPRQFGPICDRIMWAAIQSRKITTAHSGLPTVAFRTSYCNHYRSAGENPPPDCKTQEMVVQCVQSWNMLPQSERIRMLLV